MAKILNEQQAAREDTAVSVKHTGELKNGTAMEPHYDGFKCWVGQVLIGCRRDSADIRKSLAVAEGVGSQAQSSRKCSCSASGSSLAQLRGSQATDFTMALQAAARKGLEAGEAGYFCLNRQIALSRI